MPSPLTLVLHASLSLAALAVGIYVVVEKRLMIGGRFSTSTIYDFPFPSNIVMAMSFFLVSIFIMLTLSENTKIKKACEWLLIAALVLFMVGGLM